MFDLITISMVVLGVGLIGYAVWYGRRANASQLWDAVDGELLFREIVEKRGKYGSRHYSLRVRYRYRVDDQVYEGTRLCFGAYFWSGLSEVELWLEENVRDGRIEVFHDPANPKASVLMPGRAGTEGLAYALLMGVVMLGLGSAFMLAGGR